MNKETKERLEKLANDKLDACANYYEEGSDEGKQAWREGMEAVDKLIELEKDETGKALKEKELKQTKKDKIVGWGLKIIEIAAIPIALCLINNKAKRETLHEINDFERGGDMYCSTGGRTVGNMIK